MKLKNIVLSLMVVVAAIGSSIDAKSRCCGNQNTCCPTTTTCTSGCNTCPTC